MNSKRKTAAARAMPVTKTSAPAARTSAKANDNKGPQIDLDRHIPAFFTQISNRYARYTNELYQQKFGVSATEWRILMLLVIEPSIAARRICDLIGYDKGPVSRTLTGLQDSGLITIKADPLDRRSHNIQVTAKGRRLHDKIYTAAKEQEQMLLSGLSKTERDTLLNLLRRVQDNIALPGAD